MAKWEWENTKMTYIKANECINHPQVMRAVALIQGKKVTPFGSVCLWDLWLHHIPHSSTSYTVHNWSNLWNPSIAATANAFWLPGSLCAQPVFTLHSIDNVLVHLLLWPKKHGNVHKHVIDLYIYKYITHVYHIYIYTHTDSPVIIMLRRTVRPHKLKPTLTTIFEQNNNIYIYIDIYIYYYNSHNNIYI